MTAPSHPAPAAAPRRAARPGGLFYPYLTPHGPLTIRADGDAITDVALGDVPFDGAKGPSEAAGRAATQIQEYLAGKRRTPTAWSTPTANRSARANPRSSKARF